MGCVSADWEDSGMFLSLGDTVFGRADATAKLVQDMDISSPGGGDGGGRNAVCGYLLRPSS